MHPQSAAGRSGAPTPASRREPLDREHHYPLQDALVPGRTTARQQQSRSVLGARFRAVTTPAPDSHGGVPSRRRPWRLIVPPPRRQGAHSAASPPGRRVAFRSSVPQARARAAATRNGARSAPSSRARRRASCPARRATNPATDSAARSHARALAPPRRRLRRRRSQGSSPRRRHRSVASGGEIWARQPRGRDGAGRCHSPRRDGGRWLASPHRSPSLRGSGRTLQGGPRASRGRSRCTHFNTETRRPVRQALAGHSGAAAAAPAALHAWQGAPSGMIPPPQSPSAVGGGTGLVSGPIGFPGATTGLSVSSPHPNHSTSLSSHSAAHPPGRTPRGFGGMGGVPSSAMTAGGATSRHTNTTAARAAQRNRFIGFLLRRDGARRQSGAPARFQSVPQRRGRRRA